MKFPKNFSNLKYLGRDADINCQLVGKPPNIEAYAKRVISEVLGHKHMQQIINTYHRCPKTLEHIYDELKRFQPEITKRTKHECYQRALKQLKMNINTNEKFKLINYDGTPYIPQNSTASAELPYIADTKFLAHVKKRFESGEIENDAPTKGNGMAYIFKNERGRIKAIMEGREGYENTCYTRVHTKSPLTKNDKFKMRLVAGTPYRTILVELMLIHPLNIYLQKKKNAIAWGYETYKGGLVRLRDEFSHFNSFISLDFSAFDKRVPHWLIEDIHDLWKSLCHLDQYYTDPSNKSPLRANPSEIERLWRYMTHAATREKCVMPDGHVFERQHSGFGSGLYQTQLLGSHVNFIMINSVMFACGFNASEFEVKVLGDDSVIAFNYNGNLKDFLHIITKHLKNMFNAVVNVEKSVAYRGAENIQFLSYKIVQGEVRRIKDDLLARLLFPERYKYNKETTKTRAYGILIANFGVDPFIHDICIRILNLLKNVEINENAVPLYDRFRLQTMFKQISEGYPTRIELKKMATTYGTMYDNEYDFDQYFK
ncbi:hypothetical protein COBT_000202 [Conglomerata obtusa]